MRHVSSIDDRDPDTMWLEFGNGYVIADGDDYIAIGGGLAVSRGADILMQTRLLQLGATVDWGRIVTAPTPAWLALRREILRDSELKERFPRCPRKFEEFVAGGYVKANWRDVILSPRSHDGGFDVAACKDNTQILDEAKAYSQGNRVGHQVVRAAIGLLTIFPNTDQVRVTTTSAFAPSVEPDFRHLSSTQLELRDWRSVLSWLQLLG